MAGELTDYQLKRINHTLENLNVSTQKLVGISQNTLKTSGQVIETLGKQQQLLVANVKANEKSASDQRQQFMKQMRVVVDGYMVGGRVMPMTHFADYLASRIPKTIMPKMLDMKEKKGGGFLSTLLKWGFFGGAAFSAVIAAWKPLKELIAGKIGLNEFGTKFFERVMGMFPFYHIGQLFKGIGTIVKTGDWKKGIAQMAFAIPGFETLLEWIGYGHGTSPRSSKEQFIMDFKKGEFKLALTELRKKFWNKVKNMFPFYHINQIFKGIDIIAETGNWRKGLAEMAFAIPGATMLIEWLDYGDEASKTSKEELVEDIGMGKKGIMGEIWENLKKKIGQVIAGIITAAINPLIQGIVDWLKDPANKGKVANIISTVLNSAFGGLFGGGRVGGIAGTAIKALMIKSIALLPGIIVNFDTVLKDIKQILAKIKPDDVEAIITRLKELTDLIDPWQTKTWIRNTKVMIRHEIGNFGAILDAIKDTLEIFGITVDPNDYTRARGGIVEKGKSYVVGDQPRLKGEIFSPQTSGNIFPHDVSKALLEGPHKIAMALGKSGEIATALSKDGAIVSAISRLEDKLDNLGLNVNNYVSGKGGGHRPSQFSTTFNQRQLQRA